MAAPIRRQTGKAGAGGGVRTVQTHQSLGRGGHTEHQTAKTNPQRGGRKALSVSLPKHTGSVFSQAPPPPPTPLLPSCQVSHKEPEILVFRLQQHFKVGLLQPSAVTVYEYYSPGGGTAPPAQSAIFIFVLIFYRILKRILS